jgi:signal transduction histidine kinase
VPPGGTVTVSTGITQDWAVLEVRDDGPGIPPDEIGRVFDRFYRGSQCRTGGSGIGLAVVATLEVVPVLVEFEVAVPRLTPALR